MLVCIDPGHGGYDPGAVGPGGTREKDITLAIALLVGKLLQSAGIQVAYTRTGDAVPWPSDLSQDLAARTKIANLTKANAFLSVHANSGAATALGMEIYTTRGQGPADPIAESIVKAWSQVFPGGAIRKDLTDGDSDKEANYYVLANSKMPAVLVEVGFLSNPREEQVLKTVDFQAKAALAIAQGVAAAFGLTLPAAPIPNRCGVDVRGTFIPGEIEDNRMKVEIAPVLKALSVPYTWDAGTQTVVIK